jgi:hypothetical protein
MTERVVTLRITKCLECPHFRSYKVRGLSQTLERCDASGLGNFIKDYSIIPDWCPLLPIAELDKKEVDGE